MAPQNNIQTLVVTLGGNSTGFQGMMANVDVQVNNLANNVAKQSDRIAQSFAKMGAVMSVAFTVPIMAAGKAAIKAGADFDLGFAGVEKTVEATATELAIMRQGFADMAQDIPVAVEELLAIGQAAGQLSIANDKIIPFSETIARIATSSNLAAEEGAIILARFSNIMGMNQELFANLGSSIVHLGNKTATSEAEIVSMAERLAGAGKTVGLTIPQVLGLAASMSELGLRAELGGTGMSQTFLKIAEAIALGDDKLLAFSNTAKMSREDFAELFGKDAMGAMLKVLKGLNEANTSELVLALDDMGMEGVRVLDVLQRLSGAFPRLERALGIAEEGFISANAHIIESDKKYKSFWNQIILVQNALKDLGRVIFEGIEPALRAMAFQVKNVADWVKSWPSGLQIAAAAILSVVAAIGPFLLLIAGSIKLWAVMAFGLAGLKAGVLAVKAAFTVWNIAVVGMAAVTATLTVALGALVIYLGYKLAKAIQSAIFGMGEYNKQLERGTALTNAMAGVSQKRQSGVLQEAAGIQNLGDRQKYLAEQLDMANKNWTGAQAAIAHATAEVEALDGVWLHSAMALEQAKIGLQEAIAKSGEYGKASSELREALEAVTLEMEEQIKAQREAIDIQAQEKTAELKKKVDDLNKSLQLQVDTWGRTSEESQIYGLMMEGVEEKELAVALALADQLKALEKRDEELEQQKELAESISEANDEFLASLREQIKTFNMSSRGAELYRMSLKGLEGAEYTTAAAMTKKLEAMDKAQEMMDEGKDLTKEFMKPAEKFAEGQKKLAALYKMGAINTHTYNAALKQLQKETKKDFSVDLSVTGVEGVIAGSTDAMAKMMEFRRVASQKTSVDGGLPKPPQEGIAQAYQPKASGVTKQQEALKAKLQGQSESQALWAADIAKQKQLQAMLSAKDSGSNALRKSPEEQEEYLKQIAKNTKKDPVVLNPVNFRGG